MTRDVGYPDTGTDPDADADADIGPDDNGFELSELDRYILEFNHQGLSSREIARALKSEYGIERSHKSVHRRLTEMRQDPDNDVQINFKCVGGKPRETQRWYNIMLRLKEEISAYIRRTGFKPSSRTMFYHFQDLGLLTPKDEGRFTNATVIARLGWTNQNGELKYPKLDIDCFVDDSRKTIDNYDDSEPSEMEPPGELEDPDEYIRWQIHLLKRAPSRYDGVATPGEDGKAGGRWYNQPEYVEVWEEKNDLLPGFNTILKDKDIRIRSGKGYNSLVFLAKCTRELKALIENKGLEPEHVHIVYCGDCDPSGVGIDYYIKKRLRQLGIPEVDFRRVAVTHPQIDKYHLPLMELGKGNPNTDEYIRLYGDENGNAKATHLNAFFTEAHLPAFTEILLAAVDKHWDEDIYDEMVEEYEINAPEPDSLTEEELTEARQEMYRQITEAFKPEWYEGMEDAPEDEDDEGDNDSEVDEDDEYPAHT